MMVTLPIAKAKEQSAELHPFTTTTSSIAISTSDDVFSLINLNSERRL